MACSGSSPNLTAATWADVQACHDGGVNGDTITVTAGTYTVSAQTTITKHVKIVAGGTVNLTDNTCSGNCSTASLLHITESTVGNTKLQGPFRIDPGSGYHIDTVGVITVVAAISGKAVLVTDVNYGDAVNAQGGNFFYWKSNKGVIWNCDATGDVTWSANCFNGASFLRHKPGFGIADWKTPPNYGMDDASGDENLYVEDCVLNRMLEGVDCDDNGRTVVRYCTLTNSGIINHGVDTSGIIGARYMEIYNNTFVRDLTAQGGTCGGLPTNLGSGFIYFRGGTALVHDNVIPDVNDGTWGDKSELTFVYENLRRNQGGYPCWDTTTCAGCGYPAPHVPGWGYSTGGTNPGSLGSDVLQDLEPIYLWSNTGTGNYGSPSIADYSPNQCGGSAPNSSTYIQADREYYLGTSKPGYTPFTYPHPLTTGSALPPTGVTTYVRPDRRRRRDRRMFGEDHKR